MNAPFRFAAKACLVTASCGFLCSPMAGLFAQDSDGISTGRPATTKIKRVQATSPDAAGQGAQPSSQAETDVQKELRKIYNKNGREMPSMKIEELPNTQPQAAKPAAAPSGAPSATAARPAAPAPQAAKPNWFERTFHIGRGRKQPAPANQYAAPTPPPTAPATNPYRYPATTPTARPNLQQYHRPPIAAVPAAPLTARPAPVVAGPAAAASPAQPQFREPAPLGPPPAAREIADRGAPPTVRPGRPQKALQPLLDESAMNGDSESLDLDDDDEESKTAGQAPKVLSSDTADGPAESPYSGVKIAPNETEQQLLTSRPGLNTSEETAAEKPASDDLTLDSGKAVEKIADAEDLPNPAADVATNPAKTERNGLVFKDEEDDEEDEDDDMLTLPPAETGKHADSGKKAESLKQSEPAKLADSDKSAKLPAEKPEKAPEQLAPPAPFTGLIGVCPVVLKDNRRLVDARPDIKSEFKGRTYTFSSIEAKRTFDENPRKYAPVDGGNDVVKLTSGERNVAGTIEHAAWYRGRLYLFSTADSRHKFIESPSKFVIED